MYICNALHRTAPHHPHAITIGRFRLAKDEYNALMADTTLVPNLLTAVGQQQQQEQQQQEQQHFASMEDSSNQSVGNATSTAARLAAHTTTADAATAASGTDVATINAAADAATNAAIDAADLLRVKLHTCREITQQETEWARHYRLWAKRR